MDSFGARDTLTVGGRQFEYFRLDALSDRFDVHRLPFSLRILLENLLRREDGVSVTKEDIETLAGWSGHSPNREIAFMPARTLLQDFTGVPAIVDLAAMRDAMAQLGGDPDRINPMHPVELVIDHSVQVDAFGSREAFERNQDRDYQRNRERYAFLKWGQQAFHNFRVVPPNTGIVHQVNLEHLARVVFTSDDNPSGPRGALPQAYPDTLVGTDSHTPMVNGLGVLGWGVGGIEAEAAMLGQAISMLIPDVIGVKLTGKLPEGATATDLVLTVTELLRKTGVVGKFVEFYGPGVASLALADRATIGNMTPEYGATVTVFPVDQVTLDYLRFTGRPAERVELVEAYMKAQGLFHDENSPEPIFTDTLELDLGTVEPSIAGPRRPQDRIPLGRSAQAFRDGLKDLLPPGGDPSARETVSLDGQQHEITHGSVVIAAITSCTNTSNPSVMLAAGLLAKKARERGLTRKPWVKTSLAPGSKVVTEYYKQTGLLEPLEQLGFALVGYGCTTCIGNSGPLPDPIREAVDRSGLVAASVLSGNRNFEGRINPDVRANFLMSPPLVVAFAIAGRIDIDLTQEPLGTGSDGKPVYLRDIWPSSAEVQACIAEALSSEMFDRSYRDVYEGDARWKGLEGTGGSRYDWDPQSTYVREPPYFHDMARQAPPTVDDIQGARIIAVLGDSITTDHISPAGSILAASPAGQYLQSCGIQPADFNSYGSRRGNHEVMVRGTFANPRIRNKLVPGVEGGFTRYLPTDEQGSIYEVATRYLADGTPLVVLAGREYGSGSSRDWAAKGPYLQGIRAIIAQSFERIHRSNLIGMGVLPLQFKPGESADSLGLDGTETLDILGLSDRIADELKAGREVTVVARRGNGQEKRFQAVIRIDTPQEVAYLRHGGILQYVLRHLLTGQEEVLPGGGGPAPGDPEPANGDVDEASKASFPASDPPAY